MFVKLFLILFGFFFVLFLVQVPGPAPNLQAVSNTPTSVALSWDKPLTGNGDVVTYKLYYTDKSVGNEQVGCSLTHPLKTGLMLSHVDISDLFG